MRENQAFKQNNQRDFVNLMLPKEYDFFWGYANAINIILVGFSFSSGIPLLIILCTIGLFSIFLIEKYKIKNYCKKPPNLNHKFINISIFFLFLALFLHLFFSILMLGSALIFGKSYIDIDDFSEKIDEIKVVNNFQLEHVTQILDYTLNSFFEKAIHCWPLGLLMLLMIIYLFVGFLIKLFNSKFKKPKKETQNSSLVLNKKTFEMISKNDWPNFDYRFKKKNIILVYGWDKYCFDL